MQTISWPGSILTNDVNKFLKRECFQAINLFTFVIC